LHSCVTITAHGIGFAVRPPKQISQEYIIRDFSGGDQKKCDNELMIPRWWQHGMDHVALLNEQKREKREEIMGFWTR
jgi:hypothetical protein